MLCILANCTAPPRNAHETDTIDQPIIFQQSFINNAWGHQNRGWFIDGYGAMKTYDVRDVESWRPVERSGPDSGYISKEALLADSEIADSVIYEIPIAELRKYYSLIKDASDGELSERRRAAYDAGMVQFTCYIWDVNKEMYKAVLLSLSGDWEQTNLDPAAVKIDDWLKDLNQVYADSLASWQ
jgi:hypothetical protein